MRDCGAGFVVCVGRRLTVSGQPSRPQRYGVPLTIQGHVWLTAWSPGGAPSDTCHVNRLLMHIWALGRAFHEPHLFSSLTALLLLSAFLH